MSKKHGGNRKSLFYLYDSTQEEIAKELKITQRGACHIEKVAMKKFLERFGETEAKEYLDYFNEMRIGRI